jgi:TPR repeat protein
MLAHMALLKYLNSVGDSPCHCARPARFRGVSGALVLATLLACLLAPPGSAQEVEPGDARDDAAMVAAIQEWAEQGDAEAQLHLGIMHAQGIGLEQNDLEAAKWMHRAADQGLATAQYNYGYMQAVGTGVAQDAGEAVAWFRRAAKQGDSAAQHNLGFAYLQGQGVTEDAKEAARWFRLAAEQGFAASQRNLFMMYANGKGVDRDNAQAMTWLTTAAKHGSAGAQYDLGVVYADGGYGVAQDRIQSYAWCGVAAGSGFESAVACYLQAEQGMEDGARNKARQLTKKYRAEYVDQSASDTRLSADPRKFFQDRKAR